MQMDTDFAERKTNPAIFEALTGWQDIGRRFRRASDLCSSASICGFPSFELNRSGLAARSLRTKQEFGAGSLKVAGWFGSTFNL
jgi:hypothetical protein